MGGPFREDLLRLLEPVVGAAGLDLEDVKVTPAGRRRLLRVVVDRDGGVSLDDVAAVSTRVAAALDESDAMGGNPYVLEISSPGVDRPLTQPRHWRRARGRLVAITLADGGQLVGRVREADADEVTLGVADEERTVPMAAVVTGRVQVEFSGSGAGTRDAAESHGAASDDPDGPDDEEA